MLYQIWRAYVERHRKPASQLSLDARHCKRESLRVREQQIPFVFGHYASRHLKEVGTL
jgi:hypothetical protein